MEILNSNFTDESNLTKWSILSTNFEQSVKKGGRNKKSAMQVEWQNLHGYKPCWQVKEARNPASSRLGVSGWRGLAVLTG
jgi:hypothetical protein